MENQQSPENGDALGSYFNPEEPIAFLTGILPHWRQHNATYFITFRLADSLPQAKLARWKDERTQWVKAHPEPHDVATRREYYEFFPQRLQQWLDAGSGSCVLSLPVAKQLVENALRYFDGQRYRLDEFVVASNHVHAIVVPFGENVLSTIVHSWKSFTAHELLKVEAASRRLPSTTIWQKESFDHIVRSPASLEKFREYIRAHREYKVAAASRR